VAEGRIVLAGSLADRGRIDDAAGPPSPQGQVGAEAPRLPPPPLVRLGDLEERAGNLSAARDLFLRVRRHDPDFADVSRPLPRARSMTVTPSS
jgi:hypothetical protein